MAARSDRADHEAAALQADIDHIAQALAKVSDPLKRYAITMFVDVVVDGLTRFDNGGGPVAPSSRTRKVPDDNPRKGSN